MNDSVHRVDGALTSETVPSRWKASRAWKQSGVPRTIDLSDVDQADSSGVALLLEWMSWAREQNREVRFDHPPEGLRTIAALSQVDELLGWKDKES